MSLRKNIGKTLRFEVFKRDKFTCRYCGQTPPAVVLEVDHILPVSGGGETVSENLITACFDCNRGKGSRKLEDSITPLAETAERLAERESQLKEYRKLLRRVKNREEKNVNDIEVIFNETFDGFSFTPTFRGNIKNQFLTRLTVEELKEAMGIACSRGLDRERTIKYFCGIAWRKIKEK